MDFFKSIKKWKSWNWKLNKQIERFHKFPNISLANLTRFKDFQYSKKITNIHDSKYFWHFRVFNSFTNFHIYLELENKGQSGRQMASPSVCSSNDWGRRASRRSAGLTSARMTGRWPSCMPEIWISVFRFKSYQMHWKFA